VRVRLLFSDDGSAEMSWSVPGQVDGAQMWAYGTEFADSLGLPDPSVGPESSNVTMWNGLSTDRVELDFAQLVERIETLGLVDSDSSDAVFVSACVRHSQGRAIGEGVRLAHFDSCAVYSSDDSFETAGARGRRSCSSTVDTQARC